MAPGPHPLAGNSGEGPPIAPPNWKWRAGNRISDMYFYSPSGKQFRSRPELAKYLQTLNNPPDANLFCWKVTDEVLKNGYVPGDDMVLRKPAKRKYRSPAGEGNKQMKTSTLKPLARPPGSLVKVSYFTVQPTQVQTASASATCFGPILSQNGATFSSRAPERPRFSNQKGRKKGKNVKIFVPHSFESILAGRSSFKWLYDSATLEKFLEEARGLKTKSAAETDEMRNVLLDRHLDASNICKYPNSVIRVFVRLLRNEEAPASMSKNELAHLCVNWKCKKRHYWCLLEDGRMNCPRKFTKVHDVRSADGPSQSRGSLNQTVQMCFKRKYSDSHDAVDFKGTGHANQPGAASFRRSQESPVQIFQSQESAISSPGRDLDIATVRRDDAEGPSFEELARPSNLKLGNRVTCTLDRESALEASGGKNSRGEDPSGSEEASLRLGDRTIDHGNHATTVFQDVKDRTQPMSKHFPQYDPTSWDRASSSKAIDGVPVRVELVASEEPAPSADHRGVGPAVTDVNMQTEPDKLVPQNYKKSFLPSRPAPELYGENIIVITGFKSCASKGSASVCHGDEAAQLDGGSFAMGNSRFASASRLPSTSYDGCKPSETHFGASRADTTQRKGYCESGSRDGDLTRSFLDNINSEATELAPRRDEHVRSQEYDSNFSDSGVTKTCPEPQSKGHSVHGDFHTEEMRKSGSLASVLDHDRGNMFHGDRSKSLVSVEDITVRMAIDPRSTTSPGNADRAAFSSTDCAAQLLTAEVRHESLLSRDEDHVSQTVTNTRHMAHVSELVTDEDEGTRKELFDNGSWQENLSLILPTQAVGPRDTFACWCKICSRDFSFCRGCMCSFCQEILQPGEDWKVVKCICGHVCHMDCALAANAAGVVKELGLDGELSCPSCSRKVDLWLFFQKKIDMISSLGQVANANLKDLERLLLHSLELLKGTEKIKYKSIEELVRESYELIRNFPILDLVQSLLRAVRDELKMSHSETQVEGFGCVATQEEVDRRDDDQLARESLDNARNERLSMEQIVDKVHRAYEDALNKRGRARSAPRALMVVKPQQNNNGNPPSVPKEMIISQQDKVDLELKKLWAMRKFDAEDVTTISVLDARATAWLESLKLQRAAVEVAQAKLHLLKNSDSLSIVHQDFR